MKPIRQAIRKGLQRKKPVLARIPAVLERFRLSRPPEILAIPRRVRNPKEFGNALPVGSKVLELHFDAAGGRNLVKLVHLLHESAASLKAEKLSGVFGDTPNSALIHQLKKHFRVVQFETPPQYVAEAKEHYWDNIEGAGYSDKYLNEPFYRIVIVF